MLTIEISGTLPQVNTDLTPAFETISDIMFNSVLDNFLFGGRPDKWQNLKEFGVVSSYESHLRKSGDLINAIQKGFDSQSATVGIDTDVIPYAAIHNFGGTIKHPGSKKFQVFSYGDSIIFTHGTKPHDIDIPARPYMLFQEEDKTKILQILSNAIFTEPVAI